jgi:hypothetical protein
MGIAVDELRAHRLARLAVDEGASLWSAVIASVDTGMPHL